MLKTTYSNDFLVLFWKAYATRISTSLVSGWILDRAAVFWNYGGVGLALRLLAHLCSCFFVFSTWLRCRCCMCMQFVWGYVCILYYDHICPIYIVCSMYSCTFACGIIHKLTVELPNYPSLGYGQKYDTKLNLRDSNAKRHSTFHRQTKYDVNMFNL